MSGTNSESSSSSRQFFADLSILNTFEEATDSSLHARLPEDWFVIVADVVGSTKAIKEGRYKDVNTIGGSTIVSILNLERSLALPFVFGGDGATLAIPGDMCEKAACALLGARDLARDGFKLDLRIGMIPVRDLHATGNHCGIAKWRLSESVVQAAFSGRGWEKAEKLLKDPERRYVYEVVETQTRKPDADFSGFECRWKEVPSRNGHQLSLIILSMATNSSDHNAIYTGAMRKIREVCGAVEHFHPLALENLTLSHSPRGLLQEARVQTAGRSVFALWWYCTKLFIKTLIGSYFFRTGKDTKNVQWSRYRQDMIANTDIQKFDGMLRMVLDGTGEQKAKLERYLETEHRAGKVCYGVHVSPAALVTCLIFSHNQDHVHFVDGGDGGYALAAVMLKQQLAART